MILLFLFGASAALVLFSMVMAHLLHKANTFLNERKTKGSINARMVDQQNKETPTPPGVDVV